MHETQVSIVVDSMPSRRYVRKYPWEVWADGRAHRLVKGVHYVGKPATLCSAAHRHKETHGLDLVTRVDGDDVYLQFSERKTGQAPVAP